MADPLDALTEKEREGLDDAPPEFSKPMLATLTHEHFSDPNWIYERKLDGERCVAVGSAGEVRLLTRNEKKVDDNYPEVREALGRLARAEEFVVDGEIVAFEDGISSFSALQPRMQAAKPEEAREAGPSIYFYLFDAVQVNGKSLEDQALRSRKKVLRKMFDFEDPLRFTAHRNEHGLEYHAEACEKGWEGVIAKRADSPYRHSRSRDWLKFKCVNQQEFVIGGFTEPQGERVGFGALLIGYYEDDDLRYAGKIGTGYDNETLRDLRGRMDELERKSPPFDNDGDLPSRDVHWVTPELVCEAGFTEWTRDGKLRHPRFLGLRRDKSPEDVHREG